MTLFIYQNSQNCSLDFLGDYPLAEGVYIIETMTETALWGEKKINELDTRKYPQEI